MEKNYGYLLFPLLFLLTSCTVYATIDLKNPQDGVPPFDYVTPALEALDEDELKSHIENFSGFGTRFTGYPGYEEAADYIVGRLRSYGITDIEYHFFNLTVPVDEGAYVLLPSGGNVTLYPILPNFVCPSQTPPGGISGNLIYVGAGNPADFNGNRMNGSIVLMDFNTQYNWITAAKFGVRAVIFREPQDTSLFEAMKKRLPYVAFSFPRLYVKDNDFQKLTGFLGEEVKVVSNMRWRQLQAKNIIAYLPGTEYANQYVLLTAHYDSFSWVPSVAPGAREAIGISTLLQLAEYFATTPDSHKYTIVLVAFSGTDQGLVGSRWFVRDYIDGRWNDWGSKVVLQMNFNIKDGNRIIMPEVSEGWILDIRVGTAPWIPNYNSWYFNDLVPDLANKLRMPELVNDVPLTDGAIKLQGVRREMFAASISAGGVACWDYSGIPQEFQDSEPLALIGGPGMTWSDYFSYEKYWGTPLDTPEKLRWDIIIYKLRVVYPVVYANLNTNLRTVLPSWKPGYASLGQEGPNPMWREAVGKIVRYDPTSGWYVPVPHALVAYWDRGAAIGLLSYTFSDMNGTVFIPGLLTSVNFYAFVVNETTGTITYAPGIGTYWFPTAAIYVGGHSSTSVKLLLGERIQSFSMYTIFECGNIVVFDVGDIYFRGASLDTSLDISVRSAYSHVAPEEWFGRTAVHGGLDLGISVLHVPVNQPMEILVTANYALKYPFYILNNASEEKPEGSGYVVKRGEQAVITFTSLRAAQDYYYINRGRISKLKEFRISTPQQVKEMIDQAWTAVENCNYEEAFALGQQALVLEREAYLGARTTIEDAASTICFFGVILLPFAFLAERLFAQKEGAKRITILVAFYAFPILILWTLHPGFSLATNSPMILIGFGVLVLIIPIFGIILLMATNAIRRLAIKEFGLHYAEVPRSNALMYSFSTATLNMRKRPFRTFLILLTVILYSTAAALFTSMSAITALRVDKIGTGAQYDGILIHQPNYLFGSFDGSTAQVPKRLIEELQYRYGNKTVIAPRAWLFLGYMFRGTYVSTKDSSEYWKIPIVGVLGVTPQENGITINATRDLVNGSWFSPYDEGQYVAIIGENMARALNATPGSEIVWAGYSLTVKGIVDDDAVNHLAVDLDELRVTPMDERAAPPYNVRLITDEILILPYETVLTGWGGTQATQAQATQAGWGGTSAEECIVSLAMKFKHEYATYENIRIVAEEIFEETGMPTWIGFNGDMFIIAPGNVIKLVGWENQIAPILIGSLTILNLMLGSIKEREREMSTYSSLGLSPFHIAFLFLSESVCYAVIGGVGGYLVSMLLADVVGNLIAGLSINYASSVVIIAILIMMAATLSSSLYPSYKASKLVTPSLERRWKIPKAKGDEWTIPIPFRTTSEGEVLGLIAFIHELILGHRVEDAEVFRTIDLTYLEETELTRLIRRLTFNVRLYPYELGIEQQVVLNAVTLSKEGETYFEVQIIRKRGPRSAWERLNRAFIDLLRKQFLVWRSFTPSEREKYSERFGEMKS